MERRTPPALSFLDGKLEEARARGLLRVRGEPAVPAALSYCSNDYLGLAGRPATLHQAGAGASRLVYGDLAIFARLEEACAALVGQPHALTFTSGYAANVGLVGALAGPEDLIVSDALNHCFSIVDGARLVARANRGRPPPRRRGGRGEHPPAAHRSGRRFVVTESYFQHGRRLA